MMVTDEMLMAAAQAREALLSSLPAPEECRHKFSFAFERKMRRLLKKQKTRLAYQLLQRAASIFLAALIGVSTWLAVDTEARAAFFRWCKEIYETHVVYRFSGEEPMQTAAYRPTWLPRGYQEDSVFAPIEGSGSVVYKNDNGDILTFQYMPIQQGTVAAVVPETSIFKAVEINGLHGELYLESDPTKASVLAWFDDQGNLAFSISGCLPESDIMHMAGSVLLS